MRLVEIGLVAVYTSLGMVLPSDRNWGGRLGEIKIEMANKKAAKDLTYMSMKEFYEDAHATLDSVKNAWRNTTMHVDKQYDSERAEDIYRATRRFMETVFAKLS
jgi:hypothetical protein